MSEARSYPRRVKTEAGDVEIRLMSSADEPAVLAFGKALPTHDLLFLPRNISEPKVLSAWINEIDRGAIISLLAIRETCPPFSVTSSLSFELTFAIRCFAAS